MMKHLLVLALCVACASSANIRGSSTEPQVDDLSTPVATSAPVKAPTPDAKVSTVSAATLSAIAAQAEKFDCAHAVSVSPFANDRGVQKWG